MKPRHPFPFHPSHLSSHGIALRHHGVILSAFLVLPLFAARCAWSDESLITSVLAWGGGSNATNVPSGLTNAASIAAGFRHSIALRSDGQVVAWGDTSLGQPNVPFGLAGVLAITAGFNHSLALR